MAADDVLGEVSYLPTGRGWMLMLSEELLQLSRIAGELSGLDTLATKGPTLSEYLEMGTLIQTISDHLMTLRTISAAWPRTSDPPVNR